RHGGQSTRHELGKDPGGVAIVALETDGNQHVPGRSRHGLLLKRAAQAIEQSDPAAELAQHIGEMRSYRERAAEAQHEDRLRPAYEGDGARQILLANAL